MKYEITRIQKEELEATRKKNKNKHVENRLRVLVMRAEGRRQEEIAEAIEEAMRNVEESKKKLNKFVDDFLSFITDTINMFSNMSFKSKCKCLFEQLVIGTILLVICLIIGLLGDSLLYSIFDVIPDKLFYILKSFFQ